MSAMREPQESPTPLLDRMLDPISQCFDEESARRFIALRPDPEVQARVDELGEKANEGSLNADESAEYDSYINLDDLIATLQLKARRLLESGRDV